MKFLIQYHIKLEITLITCNLALLCSELLLNDLSTSSCNQTNYIITKQCITKSVLFGVLIISSNWILFLHNDELQRHCNCAYTIVLIHLWYISYPQSWFFISPQYWISKICNIHSWLLHYSLQPKKLKKTMFLYTQKFR